MPTTIKELRQKSLKELAQIVNDEKEKLRKLRFQNSEGKMRRNHLFSASRKTIAQAKTLLASKG